MYLINNEFRTYVPMIRHVLPEVFYKFKDNGSIETSSSTNERRTKLSLVSVFNATGIDLEFEIIIRN